MNKAKRAPLLFVGHGNPMNAIEDNEYSRVWVDVGAKLVKSKPTAIVVFSAHWATKGSYVTAMPNPKLIYDFYGFPEELYQVQYPALGAPELAKEIAELVPGMQLDHEWGLDHGAWSVLLRLFPEANIPVVQISLDYNQTPREQFEQIKKLQVLRERGVIFLGSGNIVHNLRLMRVNGNAYNWAIDFDKLAKQLLADGDYESLLDYPNLGKKFNLAVPTDEHYRPMLLTLALAYEEEVPMFFAEGFDASSISMRSFVMKG